MDKETLSNYGWIVICVLVLAVMLALATPFGTFIADGFKATYTGLFQTGDNALDVGLSAVGVSNKLPCGHGRKEEGDHSQKECGHYNCQDADCGCVPASCGYENHWSGDGLDHTTWVGHSTDNGFHGYKCQCSNWTIPEGGTYYVGVTSNKTGDYTGATAVYTEGQTAPCNMQKKDVYVYGDYEYRYKSAYSDTSGGAWSDGSTKSWGVRVLDDSKTEYGPILESINNMPTNVCFAFMNCTNLKTAPAIPSGITNMSNTFAGCTSLTTAPTIPSNVTNMLGTFAGCTSLEIAPAIPSSVTSLSQTFNGCTSLKTYVGSTDADGDFSGYVIPSSVTTMQGAFQKCKFMTVPPKIPYGVISIGDTFSKTSLIDLGDYVIPNSVKSMQNAFSDCQSLIAAPVIPSNITNLSGTFDGCTAITGIIYIHTNNIKTTTQGSSEGACGVCFRNVDMSKITLAGEASKDVLNLIGSTGKNWIPIE